MLILKSAQETLPKPLKESQQVLVKIRAIFCQKTRQIEEIRIS